jgi:hypothetical protein
MLDLKRRQFITLLGGAADCLAAGVQVRTELTVSGLSRSPRDADGIEA